MPNWIERLSSVFGPSPAPLSLPSAPVRRIDAAPSGAIPGGSSRRHDSPIGLLLPGSASVTTGGMCDVPDLYSFDLSLEQLRALYGRNALARRIVDLLPDRACWKGWTAGPEADPYDAQLWTYPKVSEAMRWAGLYGDSPLLKMTEDDIPRGFRSRPQQWLAEPLIPERIGKLHNLIPFDAFGAQPLEWNRDIRSTQYGLPLVWGLTIDGYQFRVHASRVALFRGARRPPSDLRGGWGQMTNMPDASVLQAPYSEISNLRRTWAAGAEMAERLKYSVLTLQALAEIRTGDEGGNAFLEQMQLIAALQDSTGFTVLGPQDKFEQRNSPPTGLAEIAEMETRAVSTVLGWPVTMLAGDAPGGLSPADTAGLERERQIVSAFQESAREPIESIYRTLFASQDGPTGGVVPDELRVTFNSLTEPTAAETAALRETYARVDSINIGNNVYTADDVRHSRYGEAGFSTEMEPVSDPDPGDEAQIAAVQAEADRLAAEEDPDAEPDAEPRADAGSPESVWVMIPAAETGLRAAAEAAVGQPLAFDGAPHVTLLYLGSPVSDEEAAEVIAAVTEEARLSEPMTLRDAHVHAFPMGPDGVPVIVGLNSAWDLSNLHDRLLRRLAHVIRSRQHRSYRPHLTLGYAAAPLTPEASAALAAIDASEIVVPVDSVQVMRGMVVLATVAVGS